MATYYVDSNAAGGGNGTIATPWNALASLPVLVAGDVVNLKRGSVFRETLSVSASGTSGSHITYQDYGSGAKPIVRGSDVVSSWSSATSGSSPYVGLYWQATVTTSPVMVFRGGAYLYQGSSATTLNNLEWFWATNVLYVRDDAGTTGPAAAIEAAKRNNCILASSKNFADFINVRAEHDNSVAWSLNGSPITLTGCEAVDSWQPANINGAGTTWTGCTVDLVRQTGTANSAISLQTAAATHNFRYCLIRRCGLRAIKCSAAITLNVDNCTIVGGRYPGIYNTSASTITVRNSFIGGGPVDVDEYNLTSTAGSVTVTNSHIQRSASDGRTSTGFISGTATLGAGMLQRWKAPRFSAACHVGLLSWIFDDTNPIANRAGNAIRTALGSSAGVSCAVITQSVTDWTILQALVDQGDDAPSHSRWHFDLGTASGFTAFQYTGTGTAASLSIAGTPLTLTTTCTGAPADNLSINLTTVGNFTALRAAMIAGGKYTATINGAAGGLVSVPANYLSATTIADVKTAAVALPFDLTQNGTVYNGEIVGSKADVQANLLARDRSGAYVCRSMIWPQSVPGAAGIAACAAAGYTGNRLSSMGSQRMADLPLYQVGAQTGLVQTNTVVRLNMEASGAGLGTDLSALSNTFAVTNAVQATTGKRVGSFSASFDGSSAYLSRASAIAQLDYTGGDWIAAVSVQPTSLATAEKTVFFHGTDAANFHRMWIDTAGAAHYEIQAGGVQVVHLFTNAGRVASGVDTSLCVRQLLGRIDLLWGTNSDRYADTVDANATVTTAITPANYTGTFYVAVGFNFGGAAVEKFYAGFMDDFGLACWITSNTYAQAEAMCAAGAWSCWEIHSDADVVDFFKLMADAISVHPLWTAGKFKVLSHGDALDYIRGQGTVTGDGLRLRWAQVDGASYVPASGSPLIDAGASLGYTSDLAGTAVPQGSAPDIGAFEALSAFVGAGGLVLGGSAPVLISFSPPAAGGAILGGLAPGAPIFSPSPAGGGVFGGRAQATATFTVAAAGGAVLGGSALVPGTFAAFAAGGAVLGGSALVPSIFIAAASGGVVLGGGGGPGSPGAITFDGADIMAAITAWWRANAAVQLISSDKNLWHKTAPEGAELPYSTFFLVHSGAETWTTAFPFMRSNVQVNCHASTDVEARAAAFAVRAALERAPLSIGGVPVLHVLPDQDGLQVGEGLGPKGKDCWIAFQTFDVAWTP